MSRISKLTPTLVVVAIATGVLGTAFAGSSPAVSAATTPRTTTVVEKGIDVVMDDTAPLSTTAEVAQAKLIFTYVHSLHANAIALSFPFYDTTWRSNDPHAGVGTPSPTELAAVIAAAHKDKLLVQVRPYLSEPNLSSGGVRHWRGSILPTSVKTWFATYEKFLKTYEASAKKAGATSFSVGVELNTLLKYTADWKTVVSAAKSVYGASNITYSAVDGFTTVAGTQFGFDDYQPINPGSDANATSAVFTTGFEKNLATPQFPVPLKSARLEEVWIAAVSKAYLMPYYFLWPTNSTVARSIQTNWFTGACNAFWADHMKGIYFWDVPFYTFTPTENDSASIYGWIGTPTATAVQTCFARTK
jgi:hypothetical protein